MLKSRISLPSALKITWFRRRLFAWYRKSGRNFPWRTADATVFDQILAEVFLQRTQAENVSRFMIQFVSRYPSWSAIARVRRPTLERELKPLGLWKRRAASLSLLAKELSRRGEVFPSTHEETLELPGVGQYIANAVKIFHRGEYAPLLDTNMARLLERFFRPRVLADIRYDPFLQALSHEVVRSRKTKEINWAILDFASAICTLKPKCGVCPLRIECTYYIETIAPAARIAASAKYS